LRLFFLAVTPPRRPRRGGAGGGGRRISAHILLMHSNISPILGILKCDASVAKFAWNVLF
jgi:hypothetical protein